jgi:hypothetical protein
MSYTSSQLNVTACGRYTANGRQAENVTYDPDWVLFAEEPTIRHYTCPNAPTPIVKELGPTEHRCSVCNALAPSNIIGAYKLSAFPETIKFPGTIKYG